MSPTDTSTDIKNDTDTKNEATATNDTRREIAVEVPADEVARETEKLIAKYQKLARIPGFRKGHVPASIIKQRFSQDIQNDVVDSLVPRYFQKETQSQGLIPVSQPRVTDLHVHDNEPLKFKASFDVMPEIKVEGYKELRAEKPDTSVSDEEVEQSLKDLQEQRATFTTIEGTTLSDGDFAQASVDGKPQDGEGQPVHMDDVLIEIGGKNTMPEFTDNLRGASAGDERSFEVNYPEDSADKRLAGKKFNYTAKVQSIKQKTLPELNDDFAKSLGEFASLDEVRTRIREGMEQERKHKAEHESKDKLVAELVKRNEFEIPESLVDRQVDVRLERGFRALVAQGMKQEDIKKMDFARLRAGQRDQAVQEVKASLLLEKIADGQKIEVADEEIDREIEALASQSKQTPEEIRARLTRDGALDRIRNRIRTEKTLDFLYHQSV
ncbi:MAG: trigger factor [Acidobacteriaceae bacterium]|nr:trigger factor [Acidobacteriaceae bacterium]